MKVTDYTHDRKTDNVTIKFYEGHVAIVPLTTITAIHLRFRRDNDQTRLHTLEKNVVLQAQVDDLQQTVKELREIKDVIEGPNNNKANQDIMRRVKDLSEQFEEVSLDGFTMGSVKKLVQIQGLFRNIMGEYGVYSE